MTTLTSGALWTSVLPAWERDYYSLLLLENLRTKSVLVPFTTMKEDFKAADSGVVVFTEIYDTDPNINALAESTIWLQGAYLDSRTISIQLEIHGDLLKFSDYSEIVRYVNAGNMRGLVDGKISQNQNDYLDILARNAFLTHPGKIFGNGDVSRVTIGAADYFIPDYAELARVHLEESEVPGVNNPGDGDGQTIVCVTTPRVIHDIRTAAGSNWLEVQEYAGSMRKFTSEVGMWGGVRFIKTNRMKLWNAGAVGNQSTLNGATVVGQGAQQSVDGFTVGQSNSTRYVVVAASAGFTVGESVTISDVTLNGGAGNPPLETDGTIETRRIVAKDVGGANRLVFNKPLLKPHNTGDLVTKGVDIHGSIFMGGPGVVYGVGERPGVIVPPKHDDMMMLNRYGWRGFLKFQMFRPEFLEVRETAATAG